MLLVSHSAMAMWGILHGLVVVDFVVAISVCLL